MSMEAFLLGTFQNIKLPLREGVYVVHTGVVSGVDLVPVTTSVLVQYHSLHTGIFNVSSCFVCKMSGFGFGARWLAGPATMDVPPVSRVLMFDRRCSNFVLVWLFFT